MAAGKVGDRRAPTLSVHSPTSTRGLRLWEFPCAVEDFGSRAKEAHRVVPALHDRQAIGNFAVAAAELDGDRPVRALFRGHLIHGIGVELVRFQKSKSNTENEYSVSRLGRMMPRLSICGSSRPCT